MTLSNELPSEQYRLVAKDWVQKDGAARMLEDNKTTVLSQRMSALGNMPVSTAERMVKSSPEWSEYIESMVEARTSANLAKVKMKYVEMKYFEWQSQNASRRSEMRLSA